MPQRTYEPYAEKHKWPKGFGSLCPSQITQEEAQALLDQAIRVEGVGANKLWMARGKWCFCAHNHHGDNWHGFPVIGGEVDERVLADLEAGGMISAQGRRQLRKQRDLPPSWP
jgi:hypothetical protein